MAQLIYNTRHEVTGKFLLDQGNLLELDALFEEIRGILASEEPEDSSSTTQLILSLKSGNRLEAVSFADTFENNSIANEEPTGFSYKIKSGARKHKEVEIQLLNNWGSSLLRVSGTPDRNEAIQRCIAKAKTWIDKQAHLPWNWLGKLRDFPAFGLAFAFISISGWLKSSISMLFALTVLLAVSLNACFGPRTIIEAGKNLRTSKFVQARVKVLWWVLSSVLLSGILLPIFRKQLGI